MISLADLRELGHKFKAEYIGFHESDIVFTVKIETAKNANDYRKIAKSILDSLKETEDGRELFKVYGLNSVAIRLI